MTLTAKTAAEMALGGLTHDLGKLAGPANGEDGLGAISRGLESTLCPVHRGHYTHRHVLHTHEFFEWVERNALFRPPCLDWDRVAGLAAYHHRPATPEQEIIAEADRLSAGLDREAAGQNQTGGRRRARLLSPLGTVFTSREEDWSAAPRVNPAPLSAAAAFPAPAAPDADLTPLYADLWRRFQEAWAANRCPDPLGYVNRACALLEHFTWAVPSAVNARPDVSLFDHLKTTAALAVARAGAADSRRPFLLLLGSLNGIQKHIFAVRAGAGGLARRLRARSFQAAAYAEGIMFSLLRRLRLPLTQSLRLAGGKFTLLLPHNDEVKAAVAAARARLAEWLYQKTDAELSLTLALWPLAREDMARDFSAAHQTAQRHLERERRREARDLLQDGDGWREGKFVLSPPAPRAGQEICPACGRRPTGGDNGRLCEVCLADQDLGGRLPRADRVVFWDEEGRGAFPAPGGSLSLLRPEEDPPAGAGLICALDAYEPSAAPAAPLVARPKARGIPQRAGRTLEFDDLADLAAGRRALGYLKLDVDNLGLVFAPGEGDRSLSRAAALSRSLEVFFSLAVNNLIAERFPNVYLLYAGGDDLAAIGPWDMMFDFAAGLRAEFRRYLGDSDRLTLSAGLAVVPGARPVTDAVEEAETLLQDSKNALGTAAITLPPPADGAGEPAKNRLSALGVSLTWGDFALALAEGKRLRDWLAGGAVSVGQVRRLMGYAEQYAQYQRTGDTVYFEYAPLLNRDLNRNWPAQGPGAAAREWAAHLALPPTSPESRSITRLGFVCRYALTANRRPRNEE